MDWCDCDYDSSWGLPTNWCVPTDNDIKNTLVEVFMWYDVQIQLQIREIWNHLESAPDTPGPDLVSDRYANNDDPSDPCKPEPQPITLDAQTMLLERIAAVLEQLKQVDQAAQRPDDAGDTHVGC